MEMVMVMMLSLVNMTTIDDVYEFAYADGVISVPT
jgi:hypothetical protein